MAPTNGSLTKLREGFKKIQDEDVSEALNGILHSMGQELKDWSNFSQIGLQEQDESIKFLFQVADSSSNNATAVKKKAREIIFRYVIPKVFHSRNQSFRDRINLILDFLGNPEHILFQDTFHRSLLFFLHISYRLSQNLETPEIEIDRNDEDAQAFKWLVGKICQAMVNARDYDYLENNIILEAIPALQKLCLGKTIPAELAFDELSEFFEENIKRNQLPALRTLGTLQGQKPILEHTSIGRIEVRTSSKYGLLPTEFSLVPAPANVERGFDHSARLYLPHVMWHARCQSPSLHETIKVQCDHNTDDSLTFIFWTSKNVEIDDGRPRSDNHWYVIGDHPPKVTYKFITQPR